LRLGAGSACCGRHVEADELIVATGFRPDLSFLREVHTALDPAEAAASIGLKRDAVLAGMQSAAVKDRLVRENEEAIRKGVSGSPFFLVDGEPGLGQRSHGAACAGLVSSGRSQTHVDYCNNP
jgi:hypothetical protein